MHRRTPRPLPGVLATANAVLARANRAGRLACCSGRRRANEAWLVDTCAGKTGLASATGSAGFAAGGVGSLAGWGGQSDCFRATSARRALDHCRPFPGDGSANRGWESRLRWVFMQAIVCAGRRFAAAWRIGRGLHNRLRRHHLDGGLRRQHRDCIDRQLGPRRLFVQRRRIRWCRDGWCHLRFQTQ